MPIEFEDLDPSLRLIKLSGRLDIPGTSEVETKYAGAAAVSKHAVIVDLTDVTFLASIGIRLLIANAKAQQSRGGKTVLFVGSNDAVTKTLAMTGIDSLIPMFSSMTEARQAATNT